MEYYIHRTLNKTGKQVMFYPTVNGKRLNGTNYARKYDARNLVKLYVNHYGAEKVQEMFA